MKHKKLLISLLSLFCVATSGVALAGCNFPFINQGNNATSSQTTKIEEVYQQYLIYAQAEGIEPLSYEAWLASIRGKDGKDGVGISKVELDENGDLLIIFTDGTTQTVEFPQRQEHVHTFGEWTLCDTPIPSCTQRMYYRVCTDCKEVQFQLDVSAKHTWDVKTIAPTCSAQGYDEKVCTVCGNKEKDNFVAAGHSWKTNYDVDEAFHWVACENCKEIKDKAEHTVGQDGFCSVCAKPLGETPGVVYELSSDKTYAEVIGYEGTATRVIIASEYNGVPVKTIYEKAFYDNANLTNIIIPDSVTTIGNYAFYSCNSLTSVVIPDSVTTIGKNAFYDCYKLQYTEYGNCKYLGTANNPYYALIKTINDNFNNYTIHENTKIIAGGAFSNCERLTSIVIPDSVTSINDEAFYNCNSLTNIVISDSVTEIAQNVFSGCPIEIVTMPTTAISSIPKGNLKTVVLTSGDSIADAAFYNCTSLTSITIPNSVTTIGEYAFYGCGKLTHIIIPDNVTTIGHSSFSGCNSLTRIEIPNSVTTIGEWVFSHCYNLTSIVISNGVTTIENYAFAYCTSLTSVVIPDSVTTIGELAFRSCNSLNAVYYKGTAKEWGNIRIQYDNGSLTSATRYYYSESQPTVSGNYWHYDENGEIAVW